MAGALLVVGSAAFDLTARLTMAHAEDQLHEARVELTHTRDHLAREGHGLSSATKQRDALVTSVATTRQELAQATTQVNQDDSSAQAQGLDIATLHSCLSGVSSAMDQLAASNLPGAISAINGASAPCLSVEGGAGAGLVYPFDFPDPYVLNVNGTYYAYATNSAAGNIQIITSPDLVHWSPVGDALPHLPAWAAPGATWAPSVLQVGANFVMYYSADFLTTGEQCISAAVATSPEGPFVDSSAFPIVCQLNLGGSLDPSPYVDTTTGTSYLDWKSEGSGTQPPTLWAQQLDPTGTQVVGTGPTELLQPSQPWEQGIVEAPTMSEIAGQLDLFYSGSSWQGPDYAIGLATCTSPLGPCSKPNAQPFFASQGNIVGPGGPAIVGDSQGNLWIAFAAWLPNQVGYPHSRVLFLRKLVVVNGEPVMAPPGQ